jgi:hypothetical protein
MPHPNRSKVRSCPHRRKSFHHRGPSADGVPRGVPSGRLPPRAAPPVDLRRGGSESRGPADALRGDARRWRAPAGSSSRRSSPGAARRRGRGASGWGPRRGAVVASWPWRRPGRPGGPGGSARPRGVCRPARPGSAAPRWGGRSGVTRCRVRRSPPWPWPGSRSWWPRRAGGGPPPPLPAARVRRARRSRRGGPTSRWGPEGDEPHYLMVAESLSGTGTSPSSATTRRAGTGPSTTRRSSRTTASGGRTGRSTRCTPSGCPS